jgi:hypothetical protein
LEAKKEQQNKKKWTLLIEKCFRRKVPVERIVQRKIYVSERETATCDDEQTIALRRAIFREMISEGYSPLDLASMCGLTPKAVRDALKLVGSVAGQKPSTQLAPVLQAGADLARKKSFVTPTSQFHFVSHDLTPMS